MQLIGPSYNLESRPASVQRTINMVPVPLEPGNERTAWVFEDVPGLVESVADWGAGSSELFFQWPVLLSGDAGYPAIGTSHPTVHTVGPFSFDVRLLVSGSGVSSADDRLTANGVTVRPDLAAAANLPVGSVVMKLLPAGQVATLRVLNLLNPSSSGALFLQVLNVSTLPTITNPSWADVVCLLHMDGANGAAAFIDSGPLALAVSNTGSVQTLATSAEFGTAGARFSGGNGQRLELTNPAFNLGTAYTIEWSMNTTATSGMVWCLGSETSNRAQMDLAPPAGGFERPALTLDVFNAGTIGRWDGVPNGMTTFRLVRHSATSITLFANGSSMGTRTISSGFATGPHGAGGKLFIGAKAGASALVGDIDEFRVSRTAFSAGEYTMSAGPFPES